MQYNILISFLIKESSTSVRKAIILAGIAGMSNAMILAMINAASQHAEDSEVRPLYALVFAICILIYVYSQRWILTTAAVQMENIIHRVRMRLVTALAECELLDVEMLGRSIIYQGVAQHTQTLSQAASTIALSLQMAVMIVCSIVYIGYLSLTSLLVLLCFLGIALFIYFQKFGSIDDDALLAMKEENQYYLVVSDLVDGFKEAKLNQLKSNAILGRALRLSVSAADGRAKTQTTYAQHFVFSNTTFYMLLGVMVFIVPLISQTYADVVQMSTTAVLFIIGPISGIVGSVPMFRASSDAVSAITELEEKLKIFNKDKISILGSNIQKSQQGNTDKYQDFSKIELRDAIFEFSPKMEEGIRPFKIGPIDLTITKGDTLFITGGNGSGKSTLMRVLTGLYPLTSGKILVDGTVVKQTDFQNYRELFASVFSDFHLSKYLDGVGEFDNDLFDEWFSIFEFPQKVNLEDEVFSTIDLSTGQRKRVALLTAILEKKKIMVLDEWAADQDPLFRKKFYTEIIPRLKRKGITIIAITHDSRFFRYSDHQLHMEEGQIVEFDPEIFHD
ncbi:MAG: cyclic peptide export ABC transporter [Paracoccaceae bacterium]